MKIRSSSLAFAAIASAAATTSLEAAGGDAGDLFVTPYMLIGSGELGAFEFFKQDFIVTGDGDDPSGTLGVVGFQVRWNYDEPVPDDSWASDVQVIVTRQGSGEQYTVGGLTNEPLADERWSFQGVISDGPGTYGDTDEDIFLPWIDAPLDLGTFNVMFTNDWANDLFPNLYENAEIRFYRVVPAPGAIALLALGGLAGTRRRRRRH